MFYLTKEGMFYLMTHWIYSTPELEGRNVLFNDAHNTFYLQLYGVGPIVKVHSDSERGNPLPKKALKTENVSRLKISWGKAWLIYLTYQSWLVNQGRKEMFYLTTHSTHFIYGYMASVVNQRSLQVNLYGHG